MLIQHTPLAPDVEYFLDCAIEHTEIDGATLFALKLYGSRRTITDIVDETVPVGMSYFDNEGQRAIRPRLAKCYRLMNYADTIIAALPDDLRSAVCYGGFQHLRYEVDRTAHFLATWSYQDAIIGGCSQHYKPIRTHWQRAYLPSPRQRRRLYGMNWIRRAVKREPETHSLRDMGSRALCRAVGVDFDAARADGERITRELRAQHEAYRRTNEAHIRRWAVEMRDDKQSRALRATNRKVIKRAATTAVSLVGANEVSVFARGGRVILPGQTLALEVTRFGSSAEIGHGGLKVVAVDKDTGERLADLCVYHEGTPALDQLTALALGMKAGEEAEILATANLSNVSDAGRAHPLIAERGLPEHKWEPRDETARGNEAYWDETKAMWREALGTFVLGRMWPRLERRAA